MLNKMLKNNLLIMVMLCLTNTIHADESLYDLYVRATQYDENYLANKAQIQSARLDSEIVKSELYPSISSGITRSEVESVNKGPQRSVTATGRYNNTNYQVQLSQPIYDQELFDRIQAEEYNQGALDYKLTGIREALMVNVTNLYWQVKVSYQNLEYQKIKFELQQEKLQVGSLKQSRGQVSKEVIDLLQAEKLSQQYQLDISQSRYLDAKNDLFAITLFDYSPVEIHEICPSLNLPVGDTQQYLDFAVATNSEMNIYRKELKASQQKYQSKRSAYLPKLKFDVEYNTSSEEGGSFDGSESQKTQANISLSWPIYMGGRRSLESQKSAMEVALAQSKLEINLPKLKHKIENRQRKIKLSERLLIALNKESKSRQSRVTSVARRVDLGASTRIELLEEKVNYQELLTRQQRSCQDLITNQIEMLSLIGSLNAEIHLTESF